MPADPLGEPGGEMGITKNQSAANRTAIIDAAAKLFRERGVEAVGVSELMRQAGFTHGGFYNHFPSKDALVAEVVSRAMGMAGEDGCASAFCADTTDDLATRVDTYLSPSHRDDVSGCELAGLVCDIARMGDRAQEHFAKGLRTALAAAARPGMGEPGHWESQPAIVARICQMVGTLILSRAVAVADPQLADEILLDSKRDLLGRLNDQPA